MLWVLTAGGLPTPALRQARARRSRPAAARAFSTVRAGAAAAGEVKCSIESDSRHGHVVRVKIDRASGELTPSPPTASAAASSAAAAAAAARRRPFAARLSKNDRRHCRAADAQQMADSLHAAEAEAEEAAAAATPAEQRSRYCRQPLLRQQGQESRAGVTQQTGIMLAGCPYASNENLRMSCLCRICLVMRPLPEDIQRDRITAQLDLPAELL
eukprot:COSAG01_NODE_8571_length_2736_cov_1.293895_2_plen_214_part_00